MSKINVAGISRRSFLSRSTTVAIGAGVASPFLNSFNPPAWAADVSLDFEGWNYDPAFQTEIVNEFVKQNPDIKTKFVAEPADVYIQKMIARFTSGNPPDVL